MAERAREAAPKAEVVVGDAASLPFEDGEFDVALSAFVVFFMADPTAALRDWGRVAGRLAISTWTGSDPRWVWEREVRMPFAAEIGHERLHDVMAGMRTLERFDDADKVREELRAAGWKPDSIEPHSIEFTFKTEDDWWAWSWSHGTRVFLEQLSEDARERFRAAAYERMQDIREADGVPRRYTALFARATT